MPRLKPGDWEDISLKYQTGEFSQADLAKRYGVSRKSISVFIKKQGLTPNESAKAAIREFTHGLNHLQEVANADYKAKVTQGNGTEGDGVAILENSEIKKVTFGNYGLADEVLSIIKDKNPQFARAIQGLGAKLINRTRELLDAPTITAGDINNLASAVSKVNDTLGVFPKAPSIAQQFNFNQKANDGKDGKEPKKPFEIEVKILNES